MNKNGMTLLVLVIVIVVMLIIASAIIISIERTNLIPKTNKAINDYNLLHMQQMANMAYSKVYFEKLSDGVREQITAEEIRNQLLKDGIDEERVNIYEINVEEGNVKVTIKKQENK